jgi:hypothetical protein
MDRERGGERQRRRTEDCRLSRPRVHTTVCGESATSYQPSATSWPRWRAASSGSVCRKREEAEDGLEALSALYREYSIDEKSRQVFVSSSKVNTQLDGNTRATTNNMNDAIPQHRHRTSHTPTAHPSYSYSLAAFTSAIVCGMPDWSPPSHRYGRGYSGRLTRSWSGSET